MPDRKIHRPPNWALVVLLFLIGSLGASVHAAGDAETLYERGFQLIQENRKQEAIDAFLAALDRKPEWAEAHHHLGVLYFETQQGPAAVFHLRQAERAYRRRTDDPAARNLQAVRRNLKKAYTRLQLNPESFDKAEFRPSPAHASWTASGMGFLVSPHGHLVAPLHSIQNARQVRIRFADGATAPARVVRAFTVYNVALLKISTPAPESAGLHLGPTPRPQDGPVFALVGDAAQKGRGRLRSGRLLEVNRTDQTRNLIQTTIPLRPGESGNPLFDAGGAVVGMLFAEAAIKSTFEVISMGADAGSFALKSDYLLKVLPGALVEDGNFHRTGPAAANSPLPAEDPAGFFQAVQRNLIELETRR
ncbi:MAG: trypsin-like peptidase domain-containing protein [Nitrospinaceae bacterium]